MRQYMNDGVEICMVILGFRNWGKSRSADKVGLFFVRFLAIRIQEEQLCFTQD
jgi:hypothetical protein